jgi:hypothetical protein
MPIKKRITRTSRSRLRDKQSQLSYSGVLCKLIGGGGLFNFFRRLIPHKKISIKMSDMNGYNLCDKLNGKWDDITLGGQPSYQFFNSQDNVKKLKQLGIYIDKSRDNVVSCHRKKYKDYKGYTDEEKRKKFTTKRYRFVYVPYIGSGTKDYSTTERYIKCESEYSKMERASIEYMLLLMNIIKKIVEECISLRHSAEIIKSLKCIIIIFNNNDLIQLLFNGSRDSSGYSYGRSNSSGKTILADIFKGGANSEFAQIYTLLLGTNNKDTSRSYGYGHGSEEVSSSIQAKALEFLEMDMFFENTEYHQKYIKFLKMLISAYIQPAINQLTTEKSKY